MTGPIDRAGPAIRIVTVVCCFVVLVTSAPAATVEVPIKLQTALLKKVMSYDKTLQRAQGVEVLVVYDGAPGVEHAEVARAFNDLSVSSRVVALADVETSLGPTSVIYVNQGSVSVKEVSRRHGVLTIGGHHSLVESGDIVIGIALMDGKPRIFINRATLHESGHELSSKLLELATLID